MYNDNKQNLAKLKIYYHWQHFEASHSSAVARVQLSLGTGGTGVGAVSTCLTALRAILSAAARLRATYERIHAQFFIF